MSRFLNRNQIDLLLDEQRQILNCDISKKHECSSNIEFLKIEYNKRLRLEIKIKRRNQIEKLVEKLKLPPTNNYKRKSRIIESNYITIDTNVILSLVKSIESIEFELVFLTIEPA